MSPEANLRQSHDRRTSGEITVRPAEMRDIPAIAQVHHDSWLHSVRGQFPLEVLNRKTVPFRVQQWTDILEQTTPVPTLVAEIDGIVAGLVATKLHSQAVGEIEKLYVAPSQIGRGLGTALLQSAVEQLKQLGCNEALLWVNELNVDAQSFYRRHGWRPDGATDKQSVPQTDEFVTVIRFRRELVDL